MNDALNLGVFLEDGFGGCKVLQVNLFESRAHAGDFLYSVEHFNL